MFPISITSEIETEGELAYFFESLKYKSYNQITKIRKDYLEEVYDDKTHLTTEEINTLQKDIKNFLINIDKLIEFSEQIEKIKTQSNKEEVSDES